MGRLLVDAALVAVEVDAGVYGQMSTLVNG
jgi:hypothetical protein